MNESPTTDDAASAGPARRHAYVLGLTLKESIFLAACAALVVAAKIVLRLPIRVPGHSNLFILLILVFGAVAVGRPGAGLLMGITSGVLAALFGHSKEGPYVIVKFVAPGLAIDALLLAVPAAVQGWRLLLVTGAAGVAGGIARAVAAYIGKVAIGLDEEAGLPLLVSMLASHVGFGIVGGLLAAPILLSLEKAGVVRFRLPSPPPPPQDP